jgi:hypothetical protein
MFESITNPIVEAAQKLRALHNRQNAISMSSVAPSQTYQAPGELAAEAAKVGQTENVVSVHGADYNPSKWRPEAKQMTEAEREAFNIAQTGYTGRSEFQGTRGPRCPLTGMYPPALPQGRAVVKPEQHHDAPLFERLMAEQDLAEIKEAVFLGAAQYRQQCEGFKAITHTHFYIDRTKKKIEACHNPEELQCLGAELKALQNIPLEVRLSASRKLRLAFDGIVFKPFTDYLGGAKHYAETYLQEAIAAEEAFFKAHGLARHETAVARRAKVLLERLERVEIVLKRDQEMLSRGSQTAIPSLGTIEHFFGGRIEAAQPPGTEAKGEA